MNLKEIFKIIIIPILLLTIMFFLDPIKSANLAIIIWLILFGIVGIYSGYTIIKKSKSSLISGGIAGALSTGIPTFIFEIFNIARNIMTGYIYYAIEQFGSTVIIIPLFYIVIVAFIGFVAGIIGALFAQRAG